MKILVIQLRRLGDVLLTTPLLRALKTRLDCQVDLLTEPHHARALKGNPNVDHVVPPGGWPLLVWRLRRARYDVVLDCHGTPRTARLAWLSGARLRIGRRRPGRSAFYTHALPPPPARLYSAIEKMQLAEPIGIDGTEAQLDLAVSPEERHEAAAALDALDLPAHADLVAFSPVSRRRDKAWPAERFAALCDRWHEREGWRFLAAFGPGEEPQARAVLAAARHQEAHLVPRGVLSLGATRAVMDRCLLYLGNDNAIRHVAIAARLPSAAVFGRPHPESWTPPSTPIHVAAGGGQPIESVTIDVMDAAVNALLSRTRELRASRARDAHTRSLR